MLENDLEQIAARSRGEILFAVIKIAQAQTFDTRLKSPQSDRGKSAFLQSFIHPVVHLLQGATPGRKECADLTDALRMDVFPVHIDGSNLRKNYATRLRNMEIRLLCQQTHTAYEMASLR